MAYISNVKTFVRVYELGSMSAAGRDMRISAAVASSRIAELEKHLGVRLFNRTTRSLRPTEHGEIFYKGAIKILDTIDEVVAMANDTHYGLAASIWSCNLSAVHRLIPRINAGTVWINTHNMIDPNLPFGGFKQSGLGREMGIDAIHMYTETKSVLMQI